MTLKDQVIDDMKAAMRAKDVLRLGTIRLLLAALKQKEIDDRTQLDDAAVVQIVDRLIKQRKDSVSAFTQAGRLDLANSEHAECAVLETYLPVRLDSAAIAIEVETIVAELGASGPADMGKVMAAAKSRLGSGAEMGQVSAAVKRALTGS